MSQNDQTRAFEYSIERCAEASKSLCDTIKYVLFKRILGFDYANDPEVESYFTLKHPSGVVSLQLTYKDCKRVVAISEFGTYDFYIDKFDFIDFDVEGTDVYFVNLSKHTRTLVKSIEGK